MRLYAHAAGRRLGELLGGAEGRTRIEAADAAMRAEGVAAPETMARMLVPPVLGWAAVLVGGALMYFTGWSFVDPLLSIGISLFILFNAVGTFRRGTGVLMQEVPPDIDLNAARERLLAIPHVSDLHDQHTWTLDGSFNVHTVHIVVADVGHQEALAIKSRARDELNAIGIHHATIELEWAGEECGLQHH